jgi:hypothetical protein
MSFKEALELYFERSNSMQTYWNFYVTMALALLAFFATSKAGKQLRMVAFVLTVGFAAFAVVNYAALRNVTEERLATAAIIKTGPVNNVPPPQYADIIRKTIRPPSVVGVTVLHAVSDVVVLAAIWILATRREGRHYSVSGSGS